MAIDVSSSKDLKDKILETVNLIGNTVGSTLGPGGRPVLIKDEYGNIRVTKDGVSVAKAMTSLEDPVKDNILQVLKTTSQKSVDVVGDGTSSTLVLTQAIINEGFKAIEAGSNVIEVQRGLQKATAAVIQTLKGMSTDIVTEEQIKSVARLSANGDDEIANLIASALDFAKEDGVVIIEESSNGESSLEFVEGMLLERGMVNPYFVTDEQKAEAVYKEPYILMYDGVIRTNKQILSVMNFVADQEQALLLFADGFESEALSTLVVNKINGHVKTVAVKSPGFEQRRVSILEDIAVMTGGQLISEKKGLFIEEITDWSQYLGRCRTITVTPKDTTIVDGRYKTTTDEDGNEVNPVETRLIQIKSQLDNPKASAFEKEILQERIAKLTGGVAIISVGGKSEVEMKEKKDRVDDALHATKAALVEGVVPGGGVALLNCISSLLDFDLGKDQNVGRDILISSLYAPFIKILSNAGIADWGSVYAKLSINKVSTLGREVYNVKTGEYGDMLELGVIDPVKVTRTALENASSVAGTLLTTTAAVYEVPDNKTYTTEQAKNML